ncbi:MAG: type 4a pilus biogenesis protein PilO [Armatimonadota bacterium]
MKNHRIRMTKIILIVLAVVAIALAVAVVYQRITMSRLSGELQSRKHRLAVIQQDLKERTRYHQDYRELSLKLGGRFTRCTWSDQMPYMVSQLTGILQPHGVKIKTLKPEPMTTQSVVSRFPLGVEIDATIAQVTGILKDIRSTVPLLCIERLDISPSPNSADLLEVSMRIASFVVIDKQGGLSERRPSRNTQSPPGENSEITETVSDRGRA